MRMPSSLKSGPGRSEAKPEDLSFVSALLRRHPALQRRFEAVDIFVPQTLVVTTEVFDAFVKENRLSELAKVEVPDEVIAERFMEAAFPGAVQGSAGRIPVAFRYPLAVRSSSLLEDAQFRAYAGLYNTYMLSNDHPDLDCRLVQLINAIKMVYASTYYEGPKSFSKRVGHRTEEEKMAVIVQQLVGRRYTNTFYPAIAGVAQSHNYYPFAKMKPEDGIATIALGLGKAVMDGEKALRFAPCCPELLPQCATVKDTLKNSQRFFYALKLDEPVCHLSLNDAVTLVKREISEARMKNRLER